MVKRIFEKILMRELIFIDTWVYSQLTNDEFFRRLSLFIISNNLTIAVTTLSFVELFNPNWVNAKDKDRMSLAIRLISRHPTVIVDQQSIIEVELANFPNRINEIPIELDLSVFSESQRETVLLQFLHGDESFVLQVKDITKWQKEYHNSKEGWKNDIQFIIDDAVQKGYLLKDKDGKFANLAETKNIFLFSLDFRFTDPNLISSILQKTIDYKKMYKLEPLTSFHFSSLCFWYAYIEIDNSKKPKFSGSDIGDLYNFFLLPYCSYFTIDNSMERVIKRIKEQIQPIKTILLTKHKLDKILENYDVTGALL